MDEFNVETANGEVVIVNVGFVGVAIFGWPYQIVDTELASVDDLVVAVCQDIAVKAARQVFVRVDHGSSPPLGF